MNVTYEAVDRQGRRTNDSIEAGSIHEAVSELRRRGLFVTRIDESRSDQAVRPVEDLESAAGRFTLSDLATFTRQMAMMLRAGSGIVPALQAIGRQLRKNRQRVIVRSLIADLEDGSSLSDALRKFPESFDGVYRAIIAAGEASGALTEMYNRLSDMVGKRRALRNKVLGSLAYPVLLIGMCGGILTVLTFFVLPRFANMYRELRIELPVLTRFMLEVGSTLRNNWVTIVLLAGLAGVLLAGLIQSQRFKQWVSDARLALPLFGKLQIRLIQAQVFRTLGMLTEARVGILEALALVRPSTRSRKFQALFARLESAVTSGEEVSSAIESAQFIEPYICQAIRTGEDSGQLGESMTYSADVLDETNAELIQVATKMIEPLILILMGVVVGLVAVSLFLPLFDLTSGMR